MSGRRAILVVGMHRSGTSAAARALNLLGVDLPGELVGGFGGNPLGHWEPERVVRLHDAALRAAGSNVNSVFGVDARWFDTAAAAECERCIDAFLVESAADSALFAVKDPRMSLFLPLWRRALERAGVEPLVLHVFRHPAEVAASLIRRQREAFTDAVWPLGRADLLWLRYVLTAERASRGLRRAFLGYDRLLADWRGETRRVAGQLALAWPVAEADAGPALDAFLSPGQRHDAVSDWTGLSPWSRDVFDALTAATGAPEVGRPAFDLAHDAISDAGALFQPYVAALERRIAETPLRTEYGDFGEASEPAPADPSALRRERDRADRLEAALAATRASSSWRLTAPLRALKRVPRG